MQNFFFSLFVESSSGRNPFCLKNMFKLKSQTVLNLFIFVYVFEKSVQYNQNLLDHSAEQFTEFCSFLSFRTWFIEGRFYFLKIKYLIYTVSWREKKFVQAKEETMKLIWKPKTFLNLPAEFKPWLFMSHELHE